MKKITWGLLLCALFVGSFATQAVAQDTQDHKLPNVLVIMREYMKPGKAGAQHEKTESLFVQAFQKAKWQTHYVGMESLSGPSRALFIEHYDSFEAMAKDQEAEAKNPALSAAIDHASDLDGNLLASQDTGVFVVRPDLSLNPKPDLEGVRFYDISIYHIKPGHSEEFERGGKMVMDAMKKANPEAHWGCYQGAYGASENTYIFITIRKSAAEIDADFKHGQDMMSALGDEGSKKLDELGAKSIESNESNLFMINPRMSYVGDDLIKADPFWKPAMMMSAPAAAAAPKKTEAKPSGN